VNDVYCPGPIYPRCKLEYMEWWTDWSVDCPCDPTRCPGLTVQLLSRALNTPGLHVFCNGLGFA
jgi:hypothetical protein